MDSAKFGDAFNAAPRPVRSFIIDGKLDAAVQEIATSRNLHVDTAGKLQDLTTQLLVGIISPAQIVGELVMAGVDGETAKRILEDLNQKIFQTVSENVRHFNETGEDLFAAPEKEEISSTSVTTVPSTPTQTAPLASAVIHTENPSGTVPRTLPETHTSPPAVQQPISEPVSIPTPPPVAVSVPLPESVPVVAPAAPEPVVSQPATPYISPSPQPAPLPVQNPQPPIPPAPSFSNGEEHPSMRTMASDMQALKEHRMPEPLFTQAPAVPPPPPIVPPPMPASRVTPPPPSNLPGIPQVKSYGVDPYREPVE